jgi:ribonuclease D
MHNTRKNRQPRIIDSNTPPRIIHQDDDLAELCRQLKETGWFAFDTEFVGEDQFRPEVCLIQVASERDCTLIDPLDGLDLQPFWELIADESVLVLVHAGGEDLSQCFKSIGKPPSNVFDLQIGAGMVGHGYPISLSRLAKASTGLKIHKSQTLTDWRKRPLSPDQLRYAVEDVTCLRPIYDHIHERLVSLGRESWAEEECAGLARIACEQDNTDRWITRLKGVRACTGRELAIARELVHFRDELAKEYNRPARGVLKDYLVVEIARHGWTDVKRIQSLRGVNLGASAVRRLTEAVQTAKALPPDQWPDLPSLEDSPREEVLLSLLSAVLRDHCNRENLAFSLVGKKQHLRGLIRSYTRPDEPAEPHVFSAGWRKVAVGELLEAILRGDRAVRVATVGKKLGLAFE